MGVVTELYGQHTDPVTGQTLPVYRYRLHHGDGVEVHLLSYGAGISAVLAPDRHGNKEHVVLGFDSLEGYLQHQYQGSTIGRFANRIKGGAFRLNGVQCQLTVNNGSNHLHGGTIGWDKRVWSGSVVTDAVVFSLVSDAGDQGYPGTVMAQVKYSLEPPGRLTIQFTALTTASTPVSLTNHAFFNLGGHASGPSELLQHTVSLACDRYLPVTEDLIPIGEQRLVADTNYDLRNKTTFSAALDKVKGGLDHCFLSEKTGSGCLRRLAVFGHPPSGRALELWTTTPSMQVYTGNFLPTDGSLRGRGGAVYTKHGAFCCEPEELPDAVNQPSFPNCILNPGEIYNHQMMYNFTLIEEDK